jgi:hypothetical protein
MPGAKAETNGNSLIGSMDAFAAELLKQAEVVEGLADRIAARWWPSGFGSSTASGLASITRAVCLRIAKLRWAVSEVGHPISLQSTQRAAALKRWGGQDPSLVAGNSEATLDALRAKFPTASRI